MRSESTFLKRPLFQTGTLPFSTSHIFFAWLRPECGRDPMTNQDMAETTAPPREVLSAEASTRMAQALRYLQHAVTQSYDAIFMTDGAVSFLASTLRLKS